MNGIQLHFVCTRDISVLISYSSYRHGSYANPLHIIGARERYILDKSYWLVSSFNGNAVPLNGVRTGLKRERKNKRMKYISPMVGRRQR